jgi:hypothetical protein
VVGALFILASLNKFVHHILQKETLRYIVLSLCLLVIACAFRLLILDRWIPIFVDEGAHLYVAGNIWLQNQQFSLITWQHKGIVSIFSLMFYFSGEYSLLYLRLFAAICGILSILLSFKIFTEMYGFNVGLIAGVFLSIMPYHVLYSRIGLLYSFRLLAFLVIVFLTLRFQKSSEKKPLIFVLVSVLTLLLLQLDSVQLMWLIPYLASFFFIFLLYDLKKDNKSISKQDFFSRFNKKSIFLVVLVLIAALLILYKLESLQHFVSVLTTSSPDKGWEGLFGWQSLSSFFWSLTWISTYVIILVSLPIVFLAIHGLFIAVSKKSHLIVLVSWFFSVIGAMWIGYYPRRVLIVTPLFAVFAALSVISICSKIGFNFKSLGMKLKWLKSKVATRSILLICLVVTFSFWPAYQSYEYVTNFSDLQPPVVPNVLRLSFVDEWVSGFRVEEAASYITQNVAEGSTILVDLDAPTHLKALLLEYDYNIIPISQCGHGDAWSSSTYRNVLNDEEFDNAYFLFLYPSLVEWAPTSNLHWIKIIETNITRSDVDKNFAIYQSPSRVGDFVDYFNHNLDNESKVVVFHTYDLLLTSNVSIIDISSSEHSNSLMTLFDGKNRTVLKNSLIDADIIYFLVPNQNSSYYDLYEKLSGNTLLFEMLHDDPYFRLVKEFQYFTLFRLYSDFEIWNQYSFLSTLANDSNLKPLNNYSKIVQSDNGILVVGELAGNQSCIVSEARTSFWRTESNYINLNDRYLDGRNSVEIVIQPHLQTNIFIYHTYDLPQDWTSGAYLSFWVYGANTNASIPIIFHTNSWVDYFSTSIIDDFSGWKHFSILKSKISISKGAPEWGNISRIDVMLGNIYSSNQIKLCLSDIETFGYTAGITYDVPNIPHSENKTLLVSLHLTHNTSSGVIEVRSNGVLLYSELLDEKTDLVKIDSKYLMGENLKLSIFANTNTEGEFIAMQFIAVTN